jgi:hypothetical protein
MTPMTRRPLLAVFGALLAHALSLSPVHGAPAHRAPAIPPAGEPARSEEPVIFLTWHAPYGQPGATDTLSADCDSTRSDTLWLAFDPGHASPKFLAVTADILFHAAVGDTLAPFWGRTYDEKPWWIRIESEPQPGLGYPMPYRTNGGGGWGLMRQGSAALLRFIYATPYSEAAGITRQIYAAARIILAHPPAREDRCRQPICIEWSESELTYDIQNGRTFVRSGPHRFVSLNSPGGAVSEPYRRAAALHGWSQPR